MGDLAYRYERAAADKMVVYPQGAVNRDTAGALWKDLVKKMNESDLRQIVVDCREISSLDSAAFAVFQSLEHRSEEKGLAFTLENLPEDLDRFIHYIREHTSGRDRLEKPASRFAPFTRLGESLYNVYNALVGFVRYVGECAFAVIAIFRSPRRLQFGRTLYQLQRAGADAVPLVAALSALTGIVVAYQGSSSMRGFGVTIYLADVVTMGVTQEMAPLVTGMIMAGRSGAAFASEIGTMKLQEELDALSVMNFDIATYIVLPRLLALTIAGPLLTIFSIVFGLIGGMAAGVVIFKLPALVFYNEMIGALSLSTVFTAVLRGAAFGLLIALIGCFRGLLVGAAPESVGKQTTSAVVNCIFSVILSDTLLHSVFNVFGL